MAYARTWVLSNAATKAAGVCPCKDCEERQLACAGHCERYKAWKQRSRDILQEMLDRDSGARDANAVLASGFSRAVEKDERLRKYDKKNRIKW